MHKPKRKSELTQSQLETLEFIDSIEYVDGYVSDDLQIKLPF